MKLSETGAVKKYGEVGELTEIAEDIFYKEPPMAQIKETLIKSQGVDQENPMEVLEYNIDFVDDFFNLGFLTDRDGNKFNLNGKASEQLSPKIVSLIAQKLIKLVFINDVDDEKKK